MRSMGNRASGTKLADSAGRISNAFRSSQPDCRGGLFHFALKRCQGHTTQRRSFRSRYGILSTRTSRHAGLVALDLLIGREPAASMMLSHLSRANSPCFSREQREASRGSRGTAMSPPGRHTEVAIGWHHLPFSPGTDAANVKASHASYPSAGWRPCPKGMRRKARCGLPHLSARFLPQQPAERTRNRAGSALTTLARDGDGFTPPLVDACLRDTANARNDWRRRQWPRCWACRGPGGAGPVAANAVAVGPAARPPRSTRVVVPGWRPGSVRRRLPFLRRSGCRATGRRSGPTACRCGSGRSGQSPPAASRR
jgi:hypothetical protein